MSARAIRFAVVLALALAGASTGTARAAGRTVDVTIENFVFTPTTLVLDVGDTIRWTNRDSAPHSAVSVERGFVTATLAQGQSTVTTFDRPGTFDYVCGIHGTSMRGTVVVHGVALGTPEPSVVVSGHLVDAVYQAARPDRLLAADPAAALYLAASLVIGLAAIGRLVWVLRRS